MPVPTSAAPAFRPAAELSIVAVVGNPRARSRTRTVAEAVAAALAERLGVATTSEVVDLAEADTLWLGELDARGRSALDAAARADVLIAATPTYKASYTGLLRVFLDLLPSGALNGSVAVPVTIAAAATHRLVADLQLRPVLAELGASLPVTSFVVEERELADVLGLADRWAADHARIVAAVVTALREHSGVAA